MDGTIRYQLYFPEYLNGYEVETEAKGYLADVRVVTENATFVITAYDPVRLGQDVVSEIASASYAVLGNVLVVPSVTKERIASSVQKLSQSDFSELIASPLQK
jgi:hypothetical protein